MGRIRGRKPSPAMVVSIVALVFAVAGTSVAGVATISVLDKKEKKQTRKIARNEINRAAPGLSVANAVNAQNATNAENAATGSPRAYAAIEPNGALTPGYAARGIANNQVSHPDTGAYCFQLDFTPATGSANAQAEGDEDGILTLDLRSPYTDCPDNAEAEVRNFDASEGLDQNDSFIVQFDG